MFVGTVEITPEQVVAGEAAMKGAFKASDVAAAMIRAGVPAFDERQSHACRHVATRAADRVLQKARKAGRVRAVNNRNWEAVES